MTRPLQRGGNADELLETRRPHRRRRSLIGLAVVLVAGAVALGFKVTRAPSAPHTVRRPTAAITQSAAPPTVSRDANAALVQSGSISVATTVDHAGEWLSYRTGLTNVTAGTFRVSGPIVVVAQSGAPLPGTAAAIVSHHVVTGARSASAARKRSEDIRSHEHVTLLVRVRLDCSHVARRLPHLRVGSARIIVPLAGYPRPAGYRFSSLFSGLPVLGGRKCLPASIDSLGR